MPRDVQNDLSPAAAAKLRERLQGKRVAIIMSGGNITLEQLRQLV